VLTSKNATPSRDWLGIVQTSSARNKIRGYFSKTTRSTDRQVGHDKLMREMRKHGFGLSSARTMRALKTVAEAMGFKDVDDMFVQLARGKDSAQHVANRMLKILVDSAKQEEEKPSIGQGLMSTGVMAPMLTSVKRPKKHETHASNGIVVKGIDDVLVRISRCCNPVPGDEIIGFVTRGRGVSVHRADCPNADDLRRNPERIIDVEWAKRTSNESTYNVEIFIEAVDRMNLLVDVSKVFADAAANVLSCNTATHKDGLVEMRFLIQVSSLSMIDIAIKELIKLEGVFTARRMLPGDK
jgi:GTP pyrophosphokinase